MTPEAKAHIERAEAFLIEARIDRTAAAQEPLKAGDAARNAYYAAILAPWT